MKRMTENIRKPKKLIKRRRKETKEMKENKRK